MSSPSVRVGGIAAAAALAFVPTLARADVKLVQTVTVNSTGGPGGAPRNNTVSTTAYYKGNKVRQESAQQVTVLDGDSKQIYTFNPAQKTYTVSTMGAPMNNPFLSMMQFKTDIKITPTGRTKTVAGKIAKGYTYTSTITMSMNAKGQQMMKAQGQPANMAAMLPKFNISGESWVVESIPVAPVAQQAAVAMLRSVPGMENFANKLGTIKGLPVESLTNMTMAGGPMTGGKGVQVTTRAITTQIAQSPLPSSLFSVPAGYRKVEAAMPGMGGAMGGGARPGARP